MIKLKDRAIIEISGPDSFQFLQGLITNDIYKINSSLIYAAMLNAKGRFLYDFFIFQKDGAIFLDCFAPRSDEIVKKFNFYKLKAQISVKKNDEIGVFVDLNGGNEGFVDPRNDEMGNRIYISEFGAQENCDEYHLRRISLKIAEGEYDLTYDKSIINEFGFDEINAVDYEKGCYVGQELTARTHHLGQVRKKLFCVQIENLTKIEKNCEITCNEKNVGIILSSVFKENKINALALIKDEVFEENKSPILFAGDSKIIF